MNNAYLIFNVASLVVSGCVGLITWGVKSEVKAIRAEMRAGLAEAENRFFQRVNGSYVRKEVYNEMAARLDRIENHVEELD